ncbi:hypothetical protein BX286_6564 [Streptomyces sp. 3211.6]|uniref:hypothetical protein n=1 Tax=Streptomyces TaxID=1883 RepID=UPI0009A52EA6|nr:MULTISPECIES: hypothetical protein [Streptomyces]RKT08466.1 hypothetical protein BX286_6564 [Streptomyces sp. 3211.6]RPF29865.1 hypothetical protein EDD96_6409 [Streptomyces sp. Ag109_G2-6]
METPPAALSGPAQDRTAVTPGMVVTALLVPVVALLGVVTSWSVQGIDSDWVHRQQAACRHLPFPKSEYLVAWSGPVLGLSAMAVCLLLARWIRRRSGLRLRDTWPGLLALVCVLFDGPAVLLELFMLWATYTPDGSGPILGDCG